MADLNVPNLSLNRKTLQVRLTELRLSVERMELRKLQIDLENKNMDESIAATILEMAKCEESLKLLGDK